MWAGYDHLLERDVAVKHVQIPDDLPATEREVLRARVRSEARAAARLLHPSAVAIFDVVAEDGDVHLVLELVEDPTLDELVMRRGPVAVDEVAAIGVRLLDVLMAAHERGIVHRDVKPSNIFVSPDREVKLTDFGIAAMDGEARLTRTGATMGSPQFIAPEQALGHDAAPAADLWGLGASLYLAVEGVPPFERGNAIATVHAVVHEPARPFQRAGELGPILARLLEKSPDDRPDETWLRDELSRVAGVATPPAAPTTPPIVPVRSTPTPDELAPAPAPPHDEPAPAPVPPHDAPGDADATTGAEVAPDTDAGAASDAVVDERVLSASIEVPPAPPPRDDDGGVPATDRRGSPARRWLPAAAAVVLVAVVGITLLTRGGADEDPGADAEVAAPADEDGVDGSEEDATDGGSVPEATTDGDADEATDGVADADDATDDTTDDTDAAPTDLEEAPVPDDWQVVEGAAYQVAVPAGWQQQPDSEFRVDHRDPDSSTYLRVEWTPDPNPDPYADRERIDQVLADRFEDYERIQLTEVTVRGEPAAMLEYVYTDGGARLRAYNLTFLAGDRAYALNLQSQAEDWDEVEPMFAAILGGFEPTD